MLGDTPEARAEWLKERIAIHCADQNIPTDAMTPYWIIQEQTIRVENWGKQKQKEMEL